MIIDDSDLPNGEISFPMSDNSFFDGLLPKFNLKWDIIVKNDEGQPTIKAVLEGEENGDRLLRGEPVDCDWYKSVGDGWEFVIRAPLKFNFKSSS